MATAGLMRKSMDFGERIFAVLLAGPFLWSFAIAMRTHPNVVLTAISEMLSVMFILTRRPGEIACSPWAVLVAFAGTALPLLVRPGGTDLAPTLLSSIIMSCGLALSVASKLYLNRSFGLIAANRGVKVGGPYRLVRHPMYLGYIITQTGFLLSNFDWRNSAIYTVAWSCQLLRMREEESVLRHDQAYRDFTGKVSSRLIPGIY